MPKKVFIIQSSLQYDNLFLNEGWEIVGDMLDADFLVFTGGEDVSPHLYNELKHSRTFNSLSRDAYEKNLFDIAVSKNIGMIGICRGGQFLNVMNGGRMYQHVSMHTQDHKMKIPTGEEILVSSTHHQMMRPTKEAIIIATAQQYGTKEYMNDGKHTVVTRAEDDTEVVCYMNTRCLCFQPHPEFHGGRYDAMRKFFFDCISMIEEK